MKSFEPHSAEPTGAPRPLLKHTDTLSKHWAMRRASAATESDRSPTASVPARSAWAVAALKSRAPSRWRCRPLARASSVAART